MKARSLFVLGALLAAPTIVQAQTPRLSFDQAVYMTCRDAQVMQPEERKQLAIFLADHSARYRGVSLPQDERGGQLAMLVRGGCTLAPDAYLFTVIDRAILAEKDKLPKRQ
ncbi:hypothetical protein [Enhydrobacter sp.]|jgi:hypothetical protein|uniref:hypothetical protein n=1 Tax=Enhydrobacter sp. TaxID=1894999 RepID=UPI0026144F17|nr:hypothetical protein [Enhydrobacter sp.]WIM10523.1 MAG: hypothetical protein OJF58_001479 [Enhydrobacter sp.]